jgi:protein-tyrosine phosphatase
LTQEDIDDAALVLTMSIEHIAFIRQRFHSSTDTVYLLSQMIGRSVEIEDPYGWPESYYARCAEQIAEMIELGFQRIISLLPLCIENPQLDGPSGQ